MPVPDFQSMTLPILELIADEQEHSQQDAVEYVAQRFSLSDEDRNEFLPSGQQRRLDNRVGWVRTHLTKAGLMEPTRMSHFRITKSGMEVLQGNPQKIDLAFLDQFPGHLEFRKKNRTTPSLRPSLDTTEQSPKEAIETSYQRLREALAQELLDSIKGQSPSFFERLVVELLVAIGYGGSIKDAGQAIGKSGDGGIDGIIKEDKLGLDTIYLQAKRWESVVGRLEIQKFAGALMGQKARKGVFITTSTFTADARGYVMTIDSKIVLIDGKELAQLMIDYDIGVTRDSLYEVKKMNADYFADA